jgi:hypothetical protein
MANKLFDNKALKYVAVGMCLSFAYNIGDWLYSSTRKDEHPGIVEKLSEDRAAQPVPAVGTLEHYLSSYNKGISDVNHSRDMVYAAAVAKKAAETAKAKDVKRQNQLVAAYCIGQAAKSLAVLKNANPKYDNLNEVLTKLEYLGEKKLPKGIIKTQNVVFRDPIMWYLVSAYESYCKANKVSAGPVNLPVLGEKRIIGSEGFRAYIKNLAENP